MLNPIRRDRGLQGCGRRSPSVPSKAIQQFITAWNSHRTVLGVAQSIGWDTDAVKWFAAELQSQGYDISQYPGEQLN